MRRFPLPLTALAFALPAAAQLVAPTAIPKGPNPPVVFLDGYQLTCPGSFTGTFGTADTVLQASNIASVFFDNCSVTASSGKPTIETIAAAFATFRAGMTYTDGTSVPQVDVVAHSMGGLIIRQYLSSTYVSAVVGPSPVPLLPVSPIRRAIFLATPHFGSFLAPLAGSPLLSSVFGNDAQTQEMSPGSQFLLNLATWNGGLDDLHGIDAIAVAGDAGDGIETGIFNFDDGVVSLTSASLGFVRPGLTRVVTACHISSPELSLLCPQSAPGIAMITDASTPVAQIITSFLTGTTAWQSIGTAIESVSSTADLGGLLLAFQDANGNALTASSGTVATGSRVVNLNPGPLGLYDESLPAKTSLAIQAKVGTNSDSLTLTLAPAASTAVVSKPGPLMHGVVPAGSAVFPYDVASGAYVAIYGSGFATSSATASLPYPTQDLAGVTVTVNGQAAALQYVGPTQINMIFPTLPTGNAQLTVTNATGSDTTTVVIAPAVPSIFSLDGTGAGPAAAVNNGTLAIVGPSAPLKAGSDYVDLYLTGLGPTTTKNGLDYAQATVTLTIGAEDCPVVYAGRVPGVPGLDQVSCQIPAGLSGSAVPVVITAASRASNTVTLAIQ